MLADLSTGCCLASRALRSLPSLLSIPQPSSPAPSSPHCITELEDLASLNLRLSVRHSVERARHAAVEAAEAAIDFAASPRAAESQEAESHSMERLSMGGTPSAGPLSAGPVDDAATDDEVAAALAATKPTGADGVSLAFEQLGLQVIDGLSRSEGETAADPSAEAVVDPAVFTRSAAASSALTPSSGPIAPGSGVAPRSASAPASPPATAIASAPASPPATAMVSLPAISLPSAAFAQSPPFLLALEQAIWTELVQCLDLATRLERKKAASASEEDDSGSDGQNRRRHRSSGSHGSRVTLPEPLLALIPPPPHHGWPAGMPAVPATAEWLHRWGYPPVRRAQRLSFLIAAGLPALLGITEGSTSPAVGSALTPPASIDPASASFTSADHRQSTPAATSSAVTPSRSLGFDPQALESKAFDRQKLLQASSVRERLQIAVIYLGHRRRRLAAMATLDAVINGGPDLTDFEA